MRLALSHPGLAIGGEPFCLRRICDSERISAALLFLLITFFASGLVYADDNLLLNADLDQGAGACDVVRAVPDSRADRSRAGRSWAARDVSSNPVGIPPD